VNWKSVVGRTLLGLGILALTIVYVSFDIPADGLLDIREAILTVIGFVVGFWILGVTWGRLAWKVLRILVKDVGVFAETVFIRIRDRLVRKNKRGKNL